MSINIYLEELTCGHVKAVKVRKPGHRCEPCGGNRRVVADRGTATYFKRAR